jgi:hypothetical protein
MKIKCIHQNALGHYHDGKIYKVLKIDNDGYYLIASDRDDVSTWYCTPRNFIRYYDLSKNIKVL